MRIKFKKVARLVHLTTYIVRDLLYSSAKVVRLRLFSEGLQRLIFAVK
jgi:hypothetical protein